MAVGENATLLSGFDSNGILPKTISGEILRNAYGDSLVGRLAGTTPMPITGITTAFQTGDPVAGIVGEGDLKPVINAGIGTKTVRPIKAAALMYWSKEARLANPSGYMALLQDTATDAIRKAIDLAVIHGKNGYNGKTISGVEYLTQTANSVVLGTSTAQAGGISEDILVGYEQVANAGGNVTGFIADPATRVKLMRARDAEGRSIYATDANGLVDLKNPLGSLHGLPVTFGKAVKGNMGGVTDTGVRLIGGDFQDNIKFGYVENITIRRTDVGTVQDGDTEVNLFQQNMEAFIVEALFGWVIKDVNHFVKFTETAGVEGGE